MKHPILEFYGFSDIGPIRANNEDVWISLPEQRFFAVADGMGGHNAGEIAAHEATISLSASIKKMFSSQANLSVPEILSLLKTAIHAANKKVFDLSQTSFHLKGMGTTLCCLYLHETAGIYAHVGDSRLYHFRKQTFLKQLTHDHSLLNKLFSGVSPSEKRSSLPYKNIITKALGTSPNLVPEVAFITDVEKNDVFFLCTDGLSDPLDLETLTSVLENPSSIQEKVDTLIALAKEKGSNDNITLIMLKVTAFHETDLSRQ